MFQKEVEAIRQGHAGRARWQRKWVMETRMQTGEDGGWRPDHGTSGSRAGSSRYVWDIVSVLEKSICLPSRPPIPAVETEEEALKGGGSMGSIWPRCSGATCRARIVQKGKGRWTRAQPQLKGRNSCTGQRFYLNH